jgi:hypothetical protein
MPTADPLAQLRDIHLIDPWLAALLTPAGWLAIITLLLLISWAILSWRKRHQRNAFRRQALVELDTLDDFLQSDPVHYLALLNSLLKQTALGSQPRQNVAQLTGKQWLSFLDTSGQTQLFSQGTGQILIDGPYRPSPPQQDLEELKPLVQHWIKEHKASC